MVEVPAKAPYAPAAQAGFREMRSRIFRGLVGLALVAVCAALLIGAATAALNYAERPSAASHGDLVQGLPCAPGCQPLTTERFASIQEVSRIASFTPLLPSELPGTFQMTDIEYSSPREGGVANLTHNDTITVHYRDREGHVLVISEGFPAVPGIGLYLTAPLEAKGRVDLSGNQAYWVRVPPVPGPGPGSTSRPLFIAALPTGGTMLAWEADRVGRGKAILPNGEVLQGASFSISLSSDSLDVSELEAVAASLRPG